MTKMIEKFNNGCRKLLDLMQEGRLIPPEEGSITNYENGEKTISYKNGYHRELTNLINEFSGYNAVVFSNVVENYSREYIEGIINDFLFECIFNGEEDKKTLIDSFFRKLKVDLNETNEYLIPIFIENLLFHNTNVILGKVKFIPYSIFNLMTIFKEAGYTGKIIKEPSYSDISRVKSVGIVSVYAGDVTKAIEKAEDLVDQSLNVIRLLYLHSNFGIQGKYNHPLIYEIKSLNISQNTIHSYSGLSGDVLEYKIDRTKYELMNEYITNIDNILKKSENQRNKLEKKLLLAINLFGEVQKNSDHQDNIIIIFSALETLLLDENEPKIVNVAERISFISRPDKTARLYVYGLVNRMYKNRNELVHEGNTVFKEIDYNTLLVELRQCILIIAKNINDYPNFEDWINLINSAREARFDEKLSFQL
jgi:hypothetical protein